MCRAVLNKTIILLGLAGYCKRELLCHGQGLARSLLPSAVVRRNVNNDKLSTCIYCTLQLLVVQVVDQKSALDRKTLLLIDIPGPGNPS